MEEFTPFLDTLPPPQRQCLQEALDWVAKTFPQLAPKLGWNQPMFTDHGTFIIGFSAAKKHMAVGPEREGMRYFEEDIRQAGYDQTRFLFRIPWDQPVDYALLERIIRYNMREKADCPTFWRKASD